MQSNDEEAIRNLVRSTYRPVTPPPTLKERLLERLTLETSGVAVGVSRRPWEQPRLVIPILVAVLSGLIGYGAWISMNVAPTLLP